MSRNLGKIVLKPIDLDGAIYGQPFSANTDEPWMSYAIKQDGFIYVLVQDETGAVVASAPEPSGNLVEGFDCWEIEGNDYLYALGKIWNGTSLEDNPNEQF